MLWVIALLWGCGQTEAESTGSELISGKTAAEAADLLATAICEWNIRCPMNLDAYRDLDACYRDTYFSAANRFDCTTAAAGREAIVSDCIEALGTTSCGDATDELTLVPGCAAAGPFLDGTWCDPVQGMFDGHGPTSGDDRCGEVRRDIQLSEATNLGYTAQDVVDTVMGRWQGPITWQHDGGFMPPGTLLSTFIGEQTQLTLELSHTNGAIRRVRSELDSIFDGRVPCPDNLEIEAQLDIRSEDGLFDDTLSVVVATDSVDVLQAFVVLSRHPTEGSWREVRQELGAFIDTLDLDFDLQGAGGILQIWHGPVGNPDNPIIADFSIDRAPR